MDVVHLHCIARIMNSYKLSKVIVFFCLLKFFRTYSLKVAQISHSWLTETWIRKQTFDFPKLWLTKIDLTLHIITLLLQCGHWTVDLCHLIFMYFRRNIWFVKARIKRENIFFFFIQIDKQVRCVYDLYNAIFLFLFIIHYTDIWEI